MWSASFRETDWNDFMQQYSHVQFESHVSSEYKQVSKLTLAGFMIENGAWVPHTHRQMIASLLILITAVANDRAELAIQICDNCFFLAIYSWTRQKNAAGISLPRRNFAAACHCFNVDFFDKNLNIDATPFVLVLNLSLTQVLLVILRFQFFFRRNCAYHCRMI